MNELFFKNHLTRAGKICNMFRFNDDLNVKTMEENSKIISKTFILKSYNSIKNIQITLIHHFWLHKLKRKWKIYSRSF